MPNLDFMINIPSPGEKGSKEDVAKKNASFNSSIRGFSRNSSSSNNSDKKKKQQQQDYIFPSPSDVGSEEDGDNPMPATELDLEFPADETLPNANRSTRPMRSLRRNRMTQTRHASGWQELEENNRQRRQQQEEKKEVEEVEQQQQQQEEKSCNRHPTAGMFHRQNYNPISGTSYTLPVGVENDSASSWEHKTDESKDSNDGSRRPPPMLDYGLSAHQDYVRNRREQQRGYGDESKSSLEDAFSPCNYYHRLEEAMMQFTTSLLETISGGCCVGPPPSGDEEEEATVVVETMTAGVDNNNPALDAPLESYARDQTSDPYDMIQDEKVAAILKKNRHQKYGDYYHPDRMRPKNTIAAPADTDAAPVAAAASPYDGDCNNSVDTHLRALEIVARNKARQRFQSEDHGMDDVHPLLKDRVVGSCHHHHHDHRNDDSMAYFRSQKAF